MPPGGRAHAVSKNLAEAAKNVGSFGEGMGSLAAEVRRVREGVAMARETKRSPIEVVTSESHQAALSSRVVRVARTFHEGRRAVAA
jgi:hypothetical protein